MLRPGVDDYLDSEIQVNVDFKESSDETTISADIDFALSVKELIDLVEDGQAEYAVVFACRDTYFRKSCKSKEASFTEIFSAGSLRGEVLIYPYIFAAQEIRKFKCKWINSEFGKGPFSFPAGAVLALDTPQSVYIDRESFKPLSSCFTLVQSENLPPNEWQINTEHDKVQIVVSPAMKGRIDAARNSKESRAILMNSIYFSAVMQCLCDLKEVEDREEWKWQRIFTQRMADAGIEIGKHAEAWIAQQLLRHPYASLEQYFFGEKER